MEALIEAFTLYYGLDWIAMILGLYGTYLISVKSKWAFAFLTIGGLCGLAVASISLQFGFVAYNTVIIALYAKSFVRWRRDEQREQEFVAAE